MAKTCSLIGTVDTSIISRQAVLINDNSCTKPTNWVIEGYGGESFITDFEINNRSSASFNIKWDVSGVTDGDGIDIKVLDESENPIDSPSACAANTIYHYKLKISFDKYVADDSYVLSVIIDFNE